MYTSNQILFPPTLIAKLRAARGPEWAALVDRVSQLPQGHEENLALVLTMVRLDGCMVCETDSYRAMRGCDACAIQTLRRFKGSDAELLANYKQALDEVQRHLVTAGRSARA